MFRLMKYYFLVSCIAFLVACQQPATGSQPVTLSGYTMGTSYTVKINASIDDDTASAIHTALENELRDINAGMSTYLDDSELSRINQSPAGEWLPLSQPIYNVLLAAFQVNRQSLGYFDVTVGPLVNLWGFGPVRKNPGIPDDNDIAAAMKSVGMDKLLLDTNKALLKKTLQETYIDLSGIAKGYAVDSLGRILQDTYNLSSFMVEIGGEITARGVNTEGLPWQIGVEKPVSEGRVVDSILSLDNRSLASSGNYRNYFESGGKRFSHTIDPATGRPVTHNLAAVTVIHQQCMLADAWATALLAAGPDIGVQLANLHKLVAQFTVLEDGKYQHIYSRAYREFLQEK